ncbi:MAG TPA: hypothetical protein DCS82_05310 [Rhodospirillaceae bacterium]|nr:hypothetical protein [Rhodospirillaceae bacterium]
MRHACFGKDFRSTIFGWLKNLQLVPNFSHSTMQKRRQVPPNHTRRKPPFLRFDETVFGNLKQFEIKMKLKLGKNCRVGQIN